MELKNRIKPEIFEQGYSSIYEFSEQTGVNYRKVNRISSNKPVSFNSDAIVEICKALNCDIGDIFYIS